MKRIVLASLLACLCATTPLFAAETAYEWDPSARASEIGPVRVTYASEADTVTTLAVTGTLGMADTTVLTGDNAVTFAPDAPVTFAGGNLRLETPVAGGGISVTLDEAAIPASASTNFFNDYLYKGEANKRLLFPGKSIDDYNYADAYFHSGALANRVIRDGKWEERSPGRLSVECQAQDGSAAKGGRFTLVDGEDGIYGYIDYVGWYYGTVYDKPVTNGNTLVVVRTPTDASGYGIRNITIRERRNGNTLCVSNALWNVASASVGNGATLALDSLDPTSSRSFGLSLVDGATVNFKDIEDVNLTGAFSATGGRLSFEMNVDTNYYEYYTVCITNPIGHIAVKLLETFSVEDIVAVESLAMTNSISGILTKPVTCFVTRSAGEIVFQSQLIDDGLLKGSITRIYQSDRDVSAINVRSMYADGKVYSPAGAYDLTSPDVVKKGEWTCTINYCPWILKLHCRRVRYSQTVENNVAFSNGSDRLFLADANVDDILSIYADKLTGSMSCTTVPTYCFEKRAPGTLEFQLQVIDGSWLKASHYIFHQKGYDVWGYKTISKWAEASRYPTAGVKSIIDSDFVATGTSSGGSYYMNHCFVTYRAVPKMKVTVRNMGKNTAEKLTVDIGKNVAMTVSAADGTTNSLPKNGAVNIHGSLSIAGNRAINSCPINVRPGGLLMFSCSNAFRNDTSQQVTIDGGTVSASYSNGSTFGPLTDASNYFNPAVFKNGARLTGHAVRVGANGDFSWWVTGTSPSTCDSGILCVSGSTGKNEYTMTWAVEDVTGDAGVDFDLKAPMVDFEDGTSTSNGGLIHRKTGAGTLRWGGLSGCTGIVQVVNGTLLLGANNALNSGNPGIRNHPQWKAKQPVELLGGTLASEAGLVNTAATLRVTAPSALALADGASFVAEGLSEFASDATLAVTLGDGATFKLRTALTVEELSRIRVNGRRAQQDADGNVGEVPKLGMLLILR